jgi:epidermal growth factor receptor substrate 15
VLTIGGRDLADLHNDGRLTREGFAVAMHITNSRLAGNEIPLTLPPSLVPPSMRPSQASIMTTANEPQLDLLLVDTPPASALPTEPTGEGRQAQTSASVSGNNLGKDAFPSSYLSMFSPSVTQQFSAIRPGEKFWLASTCLNRSIVSATNEDLLGDDDEETSKPEPLPDNSAEIGNLRNQVSSTTRSLESTLVEKVSMEQTISEETAQLTQLHAQLASARTSYETESQLLSSLRERLVSQRVDIRKSREELIRAESELSATKVEKAEVEGSVLRDKEEIRELQRRMKEIGVETDNLKASIEKAKRDVRQQKGLLAIAKKQLATAEAEKLKSTKELQAVRQDLEDAQQEKKAVDERLSEFEIAPSPMPDDFIHVDRVISPAPSTSAAAIPLPDTPQSTTPQPSAVRQSTNPFERLALAAVAVADPSPTSRVSSAINKDSPTVETFDPFKVSSIPIAAENSPTQAFTAGAETGFKPEPTASIATGSGAIPFQESALSPAEKDAPLITTPSNIEQSVSKGLLDEEHTLSDAYHSGVQGDYDIGPLHELDTDGSETSDSDDRPVGTLLAAEKMVQLSPDDTPQPNGTIVPRLESSTPIKPAFDDTFGAASFHISSPMTGKASRTTSGSSSPKRNRSPGSAVSTHSLNSRSVGGIVDPFGAPNFSHTPLEPLGGRIAPPPTIETVLEPRPSAAALNPSSLNDFDEALGKLPNSTKDTTSAFKLDSAFDDHFDFSSAINGTTGEHMSDVRANPDSKAATATLSSPPFPTHLALPVSVEDKPRATNANPVLETAIPFASPTTASSLANVSNSVSFDDAFGLGSSIALNSNGQQQSTANGPEQPFDVFGSLSTAISGSATGNPFPTTQPSKPALAESVLSPARPTSPSIVPASPPQSRVSSSTSKPASSPPRASSPRLRAISGSKASSSENKSETPSRHKLSVS